MRSKTVCVLAHEFDCLAGHVTVSAITRGSSMAIAVRRGVSAVLLDHRMRCKHVGAFKLSVVLLAENRVLTSEESLALAKKRRVA